MQRLTAEQEADAITDYCDYTERDAEGCRIIYRDNLDTGRISYQVVDALGRGDGTGEWTDVHLLNLEKILMASITIFRDGVWAGTGAIKNGEIFDCAAVLGPTQDDSDETYEAIQDAIESGETSVARPDGEYSWKLQ